MTTFIKPQRYVNPDTGTFVHCSASDNPAHDDVAVMDEWHREKGWDGVGYNYFIQRSGNIQIGRDIEKVPAAQKGYNVGSIAICLHGLKENLFSTEQFLALNELCHEIDAVYIGMRFRGHKEVNDHKTCPVFDYAKVLTLDHHGLMHAHDNGDDSEPAPPVPSDGVDDATSVEYRFTRIEELATRGSITAETMSNIAMHARVGLNLYRAEQPT